MTKARTLANNALTAISTTELGFLDGVTSAIQTQIDSKIGQATAINPTIVDAKGDLIAATAADTVSKLSVGSNNTVLTADSAEATGLKWAAASSGGMTLLSTTTLSGASTTISSIDQTYKDLKIVGKNIYGTGSGQFQLEFNGDTGNNYANSNVNGNGTTVSTTQEESAPYFVLGYHGSNNTFSKTTNFDITIPRYSETEYHPFNSDLTGYPTSLSVWIYYTSRLRWNNTAAITQLKFKIGRAHV